MKKIGVVILVMIFLTGCQTSSVAVDTSALEKELSDAYVSIAELSTQIEDLNHDISEMQTQLEAVQVAPSNSLSLLSQAAQTVQWLGEENYTSLSTLVHPTKGVRFSPYGYVDINNHLIFTGAEVAGFSTNTQIYNWGNYDGTGDPIALTFDDFYTDFIFDQDFTQAPYLGNNTIIGTGNTLINMATAYPDGEFIEFHYDELDAQYMGMDWTSLRLVFELYQGEYLLIGIISDQWTI